jgi:hypothetical protein
MKPVVLGWPINRGGPGRHPDIAVVSLSPDCDATLVQLRLTFFEGPRRVFLKFCIFAAKLDQLHESG